MGLVQISTYLFLIATAFGSARGLSCYTCTNFVTDPTTPVTDPGACDNPGSDLSLACDVIIPSTFCGKLQGKVTGTDPTTGAAFTGEGVERFCLPSVIAAEARCYNDGDATDWVKRLFDLFGTPINDLKIQGSVCFCNSDNCNSAGFVRPLSALILTMSAVGLIKNLM